MSMYLLAGAGVALGAAFLAGLFSFRIKARWCPRCGAGFGCIACRDRERHERTAGR